MSFGLAGWFRSTALLSAIMMASWATAPVLAKDSVELKVEEDPAAMQEPELLGTGRERGLSGRGSETASPSDSDQTRFQFTWEARPGRSYLIPALEIPAYLFLLNLYDRHFTEPRELYRTNGNTFRTHLTDSKWVIDDDQFSVNQFLHPYSGTVYYGLARSAGLNFWESLAYAGAGSFLWELGGRKDVALYQ